jgi:hypothetical protein
LFISQTKNGLSVDILEKVVLLQKAFSAVGITADDFSAVLKLQVFRGRKNLANRPSGF